MLKDDHLLALVVLIVVVAALAYGCTHRPADRAHRAAAVRLVEVPGAAPLPPPRDLRLALRREQRADERAQARANARRCRHWEAHPRAAKRAGIQVLVDIICD